MTAAHKAFYDRSNVSMLNIVLIYTSEEQETLVQTALEGQNHYNLLVQMKLSQWKAILSVWPLRLLSVFLLL